MCFGVKQAGPFRTVKLVSEVRLFCFEEVSFKTSILTYVHMHERGFEVTIGELTNVSNILLCEREVILAPTSLYYDVTVIK